MMNPEEDWLPVDQARGDLGVPAGSEVDFDTEFVIRDALVPRERMCPCGCGKTWQRAVQETMHTCSLNFDQAEDLLVRTFKAQGRL